MLFNTSTFNSKPSTSTPSNCFAMFHHHHHHFVDVLRHPDKNLLSFHSVCVSSVCLLFCATILQPPPPSRSRVALTPVRIKWVTPSFPPVWERGIDGDPKIQLLMQIGTLRSTVDKLAYLVLYSGADIYYRSRCNFTTSSALFPMVGKQLVGIILKSNLKFDGRGRVRLRVCTI